MTDRPRQPPRIPEHQLAEFDLVIDVKIQARKDFDRARSYTRVRMPLDKAANRLGRNQVEETLAGAIGVLLADNIEWSNG